MPEVASFSYPFATLQQLAEDVLKHARDKGAAASEVDVSEGFGQSVGVRCDEVETIEFNRDKGVGITVYAAGERAQDVAEEIIAAISDRDHYIDGVGLLDRVSVASVPTDIPYPSDVIAQCAASVLVDSRPLPEPTP